MSNETALVPSEFDDLIEAMENSSTFAPLSTDSTNIPLLVDITTSTMLPPIREEFLGCFAHRDLHELLSAMECRFLLGLIAGTVLATCVLIISACFLLSCYVLCRIRRKRKMRRNLTVRSDSMIDLALPKKVSPPRASIHDLRDLRIPRVSQRISAYGPTTSEELYAGASEVAHRPIGTTNHPNANRFSSFSPYVPASYMQTYRAPNGEVYHSNVPSTLVAPFPLSPPDLFAEQNRRAFLSYASHLSQQKMSEDNDYDATPRRPSSQYAQRNSHHFGEADVVFRNSADGEVRNTRC